MHVSNFRPVKRVRDVVRIFAEVNRELPSVLVMVGDGPDRATAEEEARVLGVAELGVLPRQDRSGRAAARGAGPLSAAESERIVRLERARGAGVGRSGQSAPTPADCRRS